MPLTSSAFRLRVAELQAALAARPSHWVLDGVEGDIYRAALGLLRVIQEDPSDMNPSRESHQESLITDLSKALDKSTLALCRLREDHDELCRTRKDLVVDFFTVKDERDTLGAGLETIHEHLKGYDGTHWSGAFEAEDLSQELVTKFRGMKDPERGRCGSVDPGTRRTDDSGA